MIGFRCNPIHFILYIENYCSEQAPTVAVLVLCSPCPVLFNFQNSLLRFGLLFAPFFVEEDAEAQTGNLVKVTYLESWSLDLNEAVPTKGSVGVNG